MSPDAVFDVGEAEFAQRVIERSHQVPVVVDFWAEWCGPCRQLSPALEKAANQRAGQVELAKVDVDSNQGLAQAFHVQGIPAVKAFRDGEVAAEFTGAIPPAQVEQFFNELVPSEADELADRAIAEDDEELLRQVLELDPRHDRARPALGRKLLQRGEVDEALEVLGSPGGDFLADGLVARAELIREGGSEDLEPGFRAWDDGDYETALKTLSGALGSADGESRDRIRRVMVAIFTELGTDHPLAREYRRRLAALVN